LKKTGDSEAVASKLLIN